MRAIARGPGRTLSWTFAPRRVRPSLLIEGLPLAAAVFTIVGFVVAAYFRITFAYPMWVMETPAMQAIRRILNGQPLYAPPSLEYVAPVYAPLYFYVSALVASVVGVDLAAPRLVSLLASLGSAALVGFLVWSETRRALVAVIAGGLFISTTSLSAHSLDLARVDPLCLFWLLAAIATARAAQRHSRHTAWFNLASGAFTGLAILTKQTAFVMVIPLVLVPVLDRRPLAVITYLLGVGATTGPACCCCTPSPAVGSSIFWCACRASIFWSSTSSACSGPGSCYQAPVSCCCSHQSFSSDAACDASTG